MIASPQKKWLEFEPRRYEEAIISKVGKLIENDLKNFKQVVHLEENLKL